MPVAIELRHLRAIDAVAAAQTIGRAAERLGLSQPALSRQLRDLEHAAGVALLERSARGVTLTDAGASLAGDVPALLATAARLPRDVTRAKRGMEGRCVVGVVATSVTTELLSSVITRSALRYPHVHIVVVEKPTPQQPAAIFAGEIDLGLAHVFPSVSPETHDGLVTTRMHEDRLDCALLAADHPLARRRRIDPRSLATVPFLFMERGFHPGFYDRVFAELRALGLEPLIEATYDSLQQVWSLIGQGRGWGLGFHSHIERPPAGTTAIPITKLDLPWGIELLGRRAEASVAVRAVVDVFREARQLRRRHAPARGRRRKYR